MSEKPTLEQIQSAIDSSGYLMEQTVGSMLEANNYLVSTNRSFLDSDDLKPRELDVLAAKTVYRNNEIHAEIVVELLCECKNNQQPYVFISRKKNNLDNKRIPQEYIFPISGFTLPFPGRENTVYQVDAFHHLNLDKHHYFYNSSEKVIQFCKILRDGKNWVASHAEIYNEIFFKLVKALIARKKEVGPGEFRFYGEWQKLWLFFPITILNGDLYLVDSSNQNTIPKITNHVSFIRDMQASTIAGDFVIDFVTIDNLIKFLDCEVNRFVTKIVEIANQNPEKLFEIR